MRIACDQLKSKLYSHETNLLLNYCNLINKSQDFDYSLTSGFGDSVKSDLIENQSF